MSYDPTAADRLPVDHPDHPLNRPAEGLACQCGSGLFRVDERRQGNDVRFVVNCIRCRRSFLDVPASASARQPPPCFVGWFRKGRRGKWRRLTAGSSDREAFTRLQDEIRLQRLSGDLLVLPAEQHPDD